MSSLDESTGHSRGTCIRLSKQCRFRLWKLTAGMESLKTIGQLSVPTHHEASFLGKGQRRKIRYYRAFDFHDSLGICERRRIQLWEWGGEGGLGREVICFIFNRIPGLSDSARGTKCVMLSDNRGGKPRDRHISSQSRCWKQPAGPAFYCKRCCYFLNIVTVFKIFLEKCISKLLKQFLLKYKCRN